jgi:hypothetical protein
MSRPKISPRSPSARIVRQSFGKEESEAVSRENDQRLWNFDFGDSRSKGRSDASFGGVFGIGRSRSRSGSRRRKNSNAVDIGSRAPGRPRPKSPPGSSTLIKANELFKRVEDEPEPTFDLPDLSNLLGQYTNLTTEEIEGIGK